jgi:hypothetical protein
MPSIVVRISPRSLFRWGSYITRQLSRLWSIKEEKPTYDGQQAEDDESPQVESDCLSGEAQNGLDVEDVVEYKEGEKHNQSAYYDLG